MSLLQLMLMCCTSSNTNSTLVSCCSRLFVSVRRPCPFCSLTFLPVLSFPLSYLRLTLSFIPPNLTSTILSIYITFNISIDFHLLFLSLLPSFSWLTYQWSLGTILYLSPWTSFLVMPMYCSPIYSFNRYHNTFPFVLLIPDINIELFLWQNFHLSLVPFIYFSFTHCACHYCCSIVAHIGVFISAFAFALSIYPLT